MSLPYVTASKAEQISKEVAKEEIVNQKSKIVDIVNDAIESGDIDVGGGGESY